MPSPRVGLYERTDVDGLRFARSLVAGAGNNFKFGYYDGIDNNEYTIWDGAGTQAVYTHPSSALTMTISSSDANDTSAGTGARTVQVYGLDANYEEQNETATLNGQTGVTLNNTYLRINRAIVRTAGSGEQNAGTIWVGDGAVTAGEPANPYLAISPGENQTLMALWTVPANKKAYLTGIFLNSQGNANAQMEVKLKARPEGEVFQTKHKLIVGRGSAIQADYSIPPEYEEKTDIEVRGERVGGSGNMELSAAFTVVIYDA